MKTQNLQEQAIRTSSTDAPLEPQGAIQGAVPTGQQDHRPDPRQFQASPHAWLQDGLGLDAIFWPSVRAYPDRPALQAHGVQWTYRQLAQRCLIWTRLINTHMADAAQEAPVLVIARRCADLVGALLAIIHAGRPFVVVDANYPAERIRLQCAQANPALVLGAGIVQEDLEHILPDMPASRKMALVAPANEAEALPAADGVDDSFAPHPYKPSTAYLLFTSGTTGIPKCIATGPAPLRHFLDFYRDTFKPTQDDRFSLISGLGHDPMLRDIFAPLSCGACICIPDEATLKVPSQLWHWLKDSKISFMHATPQHLRLVAAGHESDEQLPRMRYIFSGGDMLGASQVQVLRELAPQVQIVNFYGSSETPQAMGYHCVGDLSRDNPVPLGKGIRDVQLLVLKDNMELAGIGELGQIGIRTRFLSDGYLGDQGATSEKYVLAPHAQDSADRIYLSGDLGVYRADGAVLARGRLDDQVKIRGYRVELAEVARAIQNTELCTNSAVIAHDTADGEKQLVAFAVARDGVPEAALEEQFKRLLGSQLPAHMVPNRWVFLPSIPLTSNGKLDRKELAAIFGSRRQQPGASLRDDTELDPRMRRVIAEIEDTLECTVTRLDHSFVDLGGDSLSYIRVSLALEQILGTLPRGWEKRPLEEFLQLLPEPSGADAAAPMWVRIEFALLLRCISIILVVANHAVNGMIFAATSALFVISGVNFSRFIAPSILESGHLRPLGRFILRFAVPAALWQVLRSIALKSFWWPSLFLLGTFYQNPERPMYTFWYLDVLAANLFIMGLVVLPLRKWLGQDATSSVSQHRMYVLTAIATAVGLVLAVLQVKTGFWDGELGVDSVSPVKWLWLVALGMMIDVSTTSGRRLLSTGAALLIAVMAVMGTPLGPLPVAQADEFLLVTALGLIWFPYVKIPRLLYKPVMAIASSTLFIYITNYSLLHHVLPKLKVPPNLVLETVIALAFGYLVTRLWNASLAFASRRYARLGWKLPSWGSRSGSNPRPTA